MSTIYDELGSSEIAGMCKIIYDNIDKDTFKKRKGIYEYHQNYGTIQDQLNKTENRCDQIYNNYLNETVQAYKKVWASCHSGDHNNDEYCRKFKKVYEKYNGNGSDKIEFKCTKVATHTGSSLQQDLGPAPRPGPEGPGLGPEDGLHEDGASEVSAALPTAAAVSSILGTVGVGLPFITYLLYKYNLLPTWLRNKLGGSRKRTTIGRQNFYDMFSDGSTEVSTVASTTTEDDSTVDTVPSGRSNNRKEQQTRKNIRYYAT
ncbi:KIR-like CYIR protein [Plasmodium coatneyi]|uniref:KIR-like CYIR protein n=1 Tax=Plasmodium coatneyi TaxID=208452 RepID=A0A1B1E6U8_9APIC|nr:KIR-like CYIR protein [Plasmodium coatneyi]ANQ10489.1 KIR-like CYIR protein [Plasmodium coatneyi]